MSFPADLEAALLETSRFDAPVVVQSQEWSAAEGVDSSTGDESSPCTATNRHARYMDMSRDAAAARTEAPPPEEALNTCRSSIGLLEAMDSDKLRCASAILFFAEVLFSASSLLVLALSEHNWIAVVCLAPSHVLMLSIEIYLARTDRSVTRYRQRLRRQSRLRWQRLCFELCVIGVLGCCFVYTLMRAWRHWKNKASRRSFLMELEAQSTTRREFVDQARLDSHAMFLSGVPRVATIVCLLAIHRYAPLEQTLFGTTLCVSSVVVVQAVVNFDYHASIHVRRQYAVSNSPGYRAQHVLFRFSEVVGRVLVLVVGALVFRGTHPLGVATAALLDYLLGVAALRCVSRPSKKAWLLGVPLLLVDLGRYVDENGFALPARRLSRLLLSVRLFESIGAMSVYAYLVLSKQSFADKLIYGEHVLALFLLALFVHVVHYSMILWSQVYRVGDDLFTAVQRGDSESLGELLDRKTCDVNVRTVDAGSRTALHAAVALGYAGCAQQLLAHGADPTLQDVRGDNPLHIACRCGDLRIAEILLTPLSANLTGRRTRDKILSSHVHQKNSDGHTPRQVLKEDAPAKLACLLDESVATPQRTVEPSLGMHRSPSGSSFVESCDPRELHELFGPLVGGEHYRFRAKPKVPTRDRAEGLTAFLFSKGVGEQLAAVLESLNERAAGYKIRLSRLKTLGTVGVGGFGKVIKVQDARTGEVYAMKLQRKDKTTRCAVREARALNMFNHAFIVRLVRIFQTRTFYCLLMEVCEKNLNEYILECVDEKDGFACGLPKDSAARYTACIMLALEYLHGQYIVFRDLKPENVLITAPSSGNHAKLTDFGLARHVDGREGGLDDDDVEEMGRVREGSLDDTEAEALERVVATECNSDEDSNAHSHSPSPGGRRYASPLAGTPAFMSSEAFSTATLDATPWCSSADIAQNQLSSGTVAAGNRDELLKWEAGRDWYALGCCLLLMLLGERGGNRVTVWNRDVLLPPQEEGMILEVLTTAMSAKIIDCDTFKLAASLTAPCVTDRGASPEIRSSGFTRAAVSELEAVSIRFSRQTTPN